MCFTFAVSSIAFISSNTHTGCSWTLWSCYTAAAEDAEINVGITILNHFATVTSCFLSMFLIFSTNSKQIQTNNECTFLKLYCVRMENTRNLHFHEAEHLILLNSRELSSDKRSLFQVVLSSKSRAYLYFRNSQI